MTTNMEDEEWYILEGMKATNRNRISQPSNINTVSATSKEKDAWFPLERSETSDSKVSSKTNIINSDNSSVVDFQISDHTSKREESTIVVSDVTNSLLDTQQDNEQFDVGSARSVPSPANLRLNLQESIDGEISNNSNSSDNQSYVGTTITAENKSVFSAIDVNDRNDEWVNLTGASNMQDVERPEPLGRTELSDTQLSPLYSNTSLTAQQNDLSESKISSSVNQSKSSHSSLNQSKSFKGSLNQSKSSHSSLNQSKSSKGSLDQSKSSKDSLVQLKSSSKGTESDIPDLSYTQSLGSTLVDNQYLNKRVGPAQDTKLQSSSNDGLSSLTSSNSEFNTHLTASKHSHETPVTKLLGPAFKQTERFLKDLQDAKLSYTNKETTLGGESHFENSLQQSRTTDLLTSSFSSKDESIQVGKSKLDVSSKLSTSTGSTIQRPNIDLIEQDIASASFIDSVMKMKGKHESLATRYASTDTVKEGSDEQSEGELLISELSENNEKGGSKSRSSISRSSSSRPSSGLEPIQEVKSPEKFKTTPLTNMEDSGSESFDAHSLEHPISATSTPYTNEIRVSKSGQGVDISTNLSSLGIDQSRLSLTSETTRTETTSKSDFHNVYNEHITADTRITRRGSPESLNTQSNNNILNSKPSSRVRAILDKTESPERRTDSIQNITIESASRGEVNFDKRNVLIARESSSKKHPTYRTDRRGSSSSRKGSLSTPSSSSTITNSEEDVEKEIRIFSHRQGDDGFDNNSMESTTTEDKSPPISIPKRSHRKIDHISDKSIESTESTPLSRPLPRRSNRKVDKNNNNSIESTTTISSGGVSHPRPLPKRSYVFPKDINTSSSVNSSRHSRSSSARESGASDRKKRSFRNASLNELWDSFERSYRDAGSDRSPLIKKLEIVSNLLKESRQRSSNRRQVVDLSDSSENNSTYCESHMSYSGNKEDEPTTLRNTNQPQCNVCPVCQRREVGTNFPTPTVSDAEKGRRQEITSPLTLQMWTQTSPYIIDNRPSNNNTSRRDTGRENTKSQQPKDPNASRSFIRQDTYTLKSPSKTSRTTHRSSNHHQKDRRKDVPYTAWFQSVLSDVSEVVPLSKVPLLSSLYLDKQDEMVKDRESKRLTIPNADLQEAFHKHKKHFIERSEARVQEIKDGVLKEKHGEHVVSEKNGKTQHGNIAVEKRKVSSSANERSKTLSRENNDKQLKTKSRTPTPRRSPVESPRNYQHIEALRMEHLRQNRLKMKVYDLKNRERFLKRRAKATIKRPQFVIVRH